MGRGKIRRGVVGLVGLTSVTAATLGGFAAAGSAAGEGSDTQTAKSASTAPLSRDSIAICEYGRQVSEEHGDLLHSAATRGGYLFGDWQSLQFRKDVAGAVNVVSDPLDPLWRMWITGVSPMGDEAAAGHLRPDTAATGLQTLSDIEAICDTAPEAGGTSSAQSQAESPVTLVSSCEWGKTENHWTSEGQYTRTTFAADCGGPGSLKAEGHVKFPETDSNSGATSDSAVFFLTGTIGETSFALSSPSDGSRWEGTLGGQHVSMVVERTDDAWNVTSGSRVGEADLTAKGPQANINENAMGPDDYLRWDNPSPVDVTLSVSPENVDPNEVGALCNLMTVGVPWSGMTFWE